MRIAVLSVLGTGMDLLRGEGAHPPCIGLREYGGGVANFHDKAKKNIGDKMRYTNLSINMMTTITM